MAVGTFYNYYENKEEIFCEVISNSWNLFLETLKRKEDLASFIREIYYYIKNNKGFGLTFKSIPIEKVANVNKLYDAIITDVEGIIVKIINEKYRDIARRIVLSLFMSVILFIDSYEFSDEDNIKFICNLFLYYENKKNRHYLACSLCLNRYIMQKAILPIVFAIISVIVSSKLLF